MFNGLFHIREPKNEPVKGYEPVSEARAGLKTELRSMLRNPVEVPCIIGGKEIHSGDLVEMNPPHNLKQSLGVYHRASVSQAEMAIDAANAAKGAWSEMDWSSRATVFDRAQDAETGPEAAGGRLAWFENPGDATGEWTRHDFSRRARGMFDKFIPRDMDGDGDVDFLGTRGNSVPYDGVFWLEQVRTAEPVAAFEQARPVESIQRPLP